MVNGLGMLIYQGIMAYEIWMGIKVPDEITRPVRVFFRVCLVERGYGRNFISVANLHVKYFLMVLVEVWRQVT